MEEIQLNVQIREKTGKENSRAVRKQDNIPAIVYGGEKEPTPVKIDRRAFERIERAHHGESIVLHLNVMEGEKKLLDYATLIKETQHNPVTDQITHIDFVRISLDEEIEVKVPIVARGDAIGVKEGGSLDHHLWEIDITCLPMNIPKNLEVDVTELKIGDAIHVKDIVLPQGIVTEHDPDDIVISVVPPMKEEAETPAEEGDASAEPEVTKEKPKEESSKGEAGSKAQEKKEG